MRLLILTILTLGVCGCRSTDSGSESEALATSTTTQSAFTATVISADSTAIESEVDRVCLVDLKKENGTHVALYLPIRNFDHHRICSSASQLGDNKVSVTVPGTSQDLIKDSGVIGDLKSINSELLYISWNGQWRVNISECTNVTDEASAKACMESYGRFVIPEGEDVNSSGATKNRQALAGLKDLLTEAKADLAQIQELEKAVYVGVVMQHFDEDQITYFTISNGKNVEPKILFEQNMVDISFDFPKNAKFPNKFSLFLPDIEGWHYEDFKEIATGDF